jgi:hypothetical protein
MNAIGEPGFDTKAQLYPLAEQQSKTFQPGWLLNRYEL